MKESKHNILSLVETIIFICILFVAIGIFLPYCVNKHKVETVDKQFYTSEIMANSAMIREYSDFWSGYDIILKQRGDTNNNGVISLEEKQKFDQGFFTASGWTVDPVTKAVTDSHGQQIPSAVLTCRLIGFYPDKPWIHLLCNQ